jgi:hypothetical protein
MNVTRYALYPGTASAPNAFPDRADEDDAFVTTAGLS